MNAESAANANAVNQNSGGSYDVGLWYIFFSCYYSILKQQVVKAIEIIFVLYHLFVGRLTT